MKRIFCPCWSNIRLSALLGLLLLLGGCTTSPPRQPDNLCAIFDEYDDWYEAASDVQERWGVPPYVTLAFMHQESRFQSKAKPPRQRILWIIPGPRPSSAYGYAQALDDTWKRYILKTGNWGADRDDFGDAADFIGWYNDETHRRAGVSKSDAYRLYLAYHEGQGGFMRGTFKRKPWLMQVARKVDRRAKMYRNQYQQCHARLEAANSFWSWF